MKLKFYINHLYVDWYVGEFYHKFFNFLKNQKFIDVEMESSINLAQSFNCNTDYNNGFPSVFSPYNLLILNEKTNKFFIHSWHDYAPAIMVNGSGIENLDVDTFSCVSRLDQNIIDTHSSKFKVQPSFYLLENTSEFDLIEKYRHLEKTIDKVYMNALCYGVRERYMDVLNQNNFFELKKKDKGGFLPKEKYYEEFAKYKYAFNLDGVAKICYRDLEAFGLGSLLFREKLNVLTYEPLEIDKHYVELIDDDIKSKINDGNNVDYILQKVESKIQEVINTKQNEYIVNEARGWFERNCLPESQINILFSFLENSNFLN